MKLALILLCGVAALLARAPEAAAQKAATAAAPAAIKHGGKIEMKYDGFNLETVVALRKMQVTCGSGKGFKDISKDVCVSLAVWLHCPGQQLDFVRRARVQLIFEAEEWDRRHTPAERGLVVVADGETLRLGSMSLVSNEVGSGLLVDKSKEVLEISIPYDAFVKIARADSVEMRVGADAFPLRDKNVAALRDLNSRVKP
ncbi:MAG TPA: hypothetical protein VF240_09155 [Pyrinomonadaceae bacterium]